MKVQNTGKNRILFIALGLLMSFSLITFISAQAYEGQTFKSDLVSPNYATDPATPSKSNPVPNSPNKPKSSSGNGLRTFYYHDGNACVKKDIYVRYITKKTAPIHKDLVDQTIIVGDYVNNPEYEWRAKVIPGDKLRAIDLVNGKTLYQEDCKLSADSKPVPHDWRRILNNYRESLSLTRPSETS